MANTSVNLKVSGAISSEMVVQRELPIRVWGQAAVGVIVHGVFKGEAKTATVNDKGEWLIEFSPQKASFEPQNLKIFIEDGPVCEFNDIWIGDVYIVSGQSNAELNLMNCIEADPSDKENLELKTVRIFEQTRDFVINNEILWSKPQADVINREWRWRKTQDNAITFSALGYYFGKELSKTIRDVPIGLVMAAAGGAQIRELMPEETAREQGYEAAAAVGIAGYYNTLLYPFRHMPFKAMLFYQGESESNPQDSVKYSSDLKAFVAVLRKEWQLNFPFYNVQLSSHGENSYDYWPSIGEMRAIQYNLTNEISNYYLITAMDSGFREGDPDFAHPMYKKILGQRFAKLILSTEYGVRDIEYSSSPYIDHVKWQDNSAVITYKYVGDGLKTTGNQTKLIGFQLLIDGRRVDTDAEIIGKDSVRITIDGAASALCYGMQQTAAADVANLVNSENLPALAVKIQIPHE